MERLARGDDPAQIVAGWASDLDRFRLMRAKYLLYHEKVERMEAMTTARKPVWLAWSSGKDSAWALHTLRQGGEFEIVALLTTVNLTHKRVAMHAVRENLVEMQAAGGGIAAGESCHTLALFEPNIRVGYGQGHGASAQQKVCGTSCLATFFSRTFARYREKQLAACGMTPVFPLWGKDTQRLAEEMIAGGLSAYLTCVDPRKLDRSFAGRRFDCDLLAALSASVDPCGENGEFHTFANQGPMFREKIPVTVGEIVERDSFVFADLLPQTAVTAQAEA